MKQGFHAVGYYYLLFWTDILDYFSSLFYDIQGIYIGKKTFRANDKKTNRNTKQSPIYTGLVIGYELL